MQSDPGADTPHTGGNDEEVWLDLVSRLESGNDAFMDAPHSLSQELATDQDPADDQESESKGVVDFDPLGVWQRESEPAPHEASPEELAEHSGTANDVTTFGPRDYLSDDGEEEFVPEELPSLRNTEPALMLAWIGAAGGPLFLVFSAIFWRSIPMTFIFGVIVAFLAGTGYLLFRLPDHRDHDSGDGAVV
ncbi:MULTISPECIES: hypothetical protein [Arthrobacter]|uniref:hypothetical protein n=1 Tax=unclassified Arthrobacter TaxID=235627 RepID=UPI0024BB9141|nr:hypothetical protein [Arthrobacter sp. H35-MC1]MDJ0318189.1 hypothetical protein [Arthrobacter sp. H35-MC1]